ncbi:M23 family metallopeptidase [Streptomyces winkii]|uniref:M23 family metallopeptidase n=1 Tax=Streptomyces winkii TaxID=3051178 RepID=UPI0028D1D8D8|nr:M23 family metallopeptidase [Streptomyces sp. DSM 40971]
MVRGVGVVICGPLFLAVCAGVCAAPALAESGARSLRAYEGEARAPAPRGAVRPGSRVWPVEGRAGAPRPRVVHGWRPPPDPWAAGHRGVDLAAPRGAPVRAVADGRVSFAGRVAGRGVVSVELSRTGRPPLRATYEPVRPSVRRGERVRAGQRVGTVADGPFHCRGPCLHWGVRRSERYLDPLSLLPSWLLRGAPSRLLPVYGVPLPEARPRAAAYGRDGAGDPFRGGVQTGAGSATEVRGARDTAATAAEAGPGTGSPALALVLASGLGCAALGAHRCLARAPCRRRARAPRNRRRSASEPPRTTGARISARTRAGRSQGPDPRAVGYRVRSSRGPRSEPWRPPQR